MHCFFNLLEHLYDGYFEYFVRSFIYLHFFTVGFRRFILFCCAIFQFLHVPYNFVLYTTTLCVGVCVFEKIAIYLHLYIMVLHREKSFNNLPGSSFCKPFKSFLWICLLWTSAYQFLIRGVC